MIKIVWFACGRNNYSRPDYAIILISETLPRLAESISPLVLSESRPFVHCFSLCLVSTGTTPRGNVMRCENVHSSMHMTIRLWNCGILHTRVSHASVLKINCHVAICCSDKKPLVGFFRLFFSPSPA